MAQSTSQSPQPTPRLTQQPTLHFTTQPTQQTLRPIVQLMVGLVWLVFSFHSLQSQAKDSEFYNDASLRTRYEGFFLQNGRPTNALNKADTEHTFTTRSQIGLNMRKGESIKARVMFQHNFTWGSDVGDPALTQGTGDTNPYQPDGTRDAQNLFLIGEAWLWWKLNEATSLRFGRGQLKLGDGKVISDNDYLNIPYALDGAILGWSSANTHSDFFAMKIAEYTQSGVIKKDAGYDLFGISFNLTHMPEALRLAHLHILQISKDALDTTALPQSSSPDDPINKYENALQNYGRIGVAVSGTGEFDWQLSYAKHFGTIGQLSGSDLSWEGQMVEGELGYHFRHFVNSRLFLKLHMDSGDTGGSGQYTRYDGFLYEVHDSAGAMDLIGFGNLSFIKLGFHFDLLEDLRVQIDAYRFGRTEVTDKVVAGPNGTDLLAGQRGSLSSEAVVGSELDLSAYHNYENGLRMEIRYSLFQPEAYLSELGGPSSTISQFLLQSRIEF